MFLPRIVSSKSQARVNKYVIRLVPVKDRNTASTEITDIPEGAEMFMTKNHYSINC
jgi:hypothetical protein